MVLILLPSSQVYFNNLSVKISAGNTAESVNLLGTIWKKYFPETAPDYVFLDDNFDKLYQAEQRQALLFTLFACVAIFIACLGLFGLSAFAISQRIKEIGVRKVLGASVSGIVGLLSKDFLKLVVIAAIFAFPIAWFAMNRWLQDFAYRTNISWWVFLLSFLLAGVVALLTISFQAIRAAVKNPVTSLRTE
jgi:putative ABC transport system permease protein